ncbi:GntR family transcriptional regulator [[Actinomadura] parvosata]|uniref:GntR family transcriptional regulator n=1 Tax=Nonomuraea composti TaxID=2720023 RepID=A0ABX1BJG7_9ACTN|nr:GntR family transcriptional regulator [Nonomuraea sp. FMUSA5-5]NJP97860.1 GntR family transcriptional regulator [Nonomuraea sp. FMUSA5-5]
MARRVDSRPRHQQVAADLRAQIMSGVLPAGAQLPSTPQLAEQYGCAPATIQGAMKLLKEERFLEGQPGRGVFVRQRQPFTVTATAYKTPAPGGYSYDLLHVNEVEPPVDIAQALDLDEGEQCVERHRVLLHDGDPIELSWSYYPLDIASGSPLARRAKIKGGAPKVLADLGFPQRTFEDRVSVRQPRTEEVVMLDLPADVPVIRQFRVIRSDDGRPVEASVLIKGGHLFEVLYQQPAQPETGD